MSIITLPHRGPGVFQSIDVEFLPGSGTNEEVLSRAGVDRCDFFVAATGLDEVNIVACALANRLGRPQTICLVSRAEFLDSAGAGLSAFGVNRVVWPEAQRAADIERIVTAPGAIDAEVFAGGIMRLLEYRLDEGSALTSAPVSHLHLPRGALIVAVKRADRMFVPRGTTHLGRQLGVPKVITRVGRPANLRLFERVGIDVAISARGAAVDSILHTITGGATSLLAVIEHGEARVFELTVSSSFAARELKTMGAGEDAIVAAILRGEQAIVPRGDDLVHPGDRLVIFSTQDAADRVREYFTRETS
jgi:Trk K+ transport system NAD-binding subunit